MSKFTGNIIHGRFSVYQLEDIIGVGGSGWVHRGIDCTTQETVAIKVFFHTKIEKLASNAKSTPSSWTKRLLKSSDKKNSIGRSLDPSSQEMLSTREDAQENDEENEDPLLPPWRTEVESLLHLQSGQRRCPNIIGYLDHLATSSTVQHVEPLSQDDSVEKPSSNASEGGEETVSAPPTRQSRTSTALFATTTTTYMIVMEFAALGSLQKQIQRFRASPHPFSYRYHLGLLEPALLAASPSSPSSMPIVPSSTPRGLWERDAVSLLLDVTAGLHFMHEHGVVHGDIKAGNILLSKDGVAKVSDFGLSSIFSSSSAHPLSCQNSSVGGGGESTTSSVCVPFPEGSLYWMAPEVLRGESGHTPASDIWSLGCLCVELLTGTPPFFDLAPHLAVIHIAQLGAHDLPPLPSGWANADSTAITSGQRESVGEGATVADTASTATRSPSFFLFPHSADAVDFIKACFQLNPSNRPSAAVLLRHPWLADARVHRDLLSLSRSLLRTSQNSDGAASTLPPQDAGKESGKASDLRPTKSRDAVSHALSSSSAPQGKDSIRQWAGPEEDIGLWVEAHLFSGRVHAEEWLWEGHVEKVSAVLPLMTPEESFRVIRNFAFAAWHCENERDSTFLYHLGGFFGYEQESIAGGGPHVLCSPLLPRPIDEAQDHEVAGHGSPSSGKQDTEESFQGDGEVPLKPAFLLWEHRLQQMCTPEDLGDLFRACCVLMDPRLPFFLPTHPRLLRYLLHEIRETYPEVSRKCLEAMQRMLLQCDDLQTSQKEKNSYLFEEETINDKYEGSLDVEKAISLRRWNTCRQKESRIAYLFFFGTESDCNFASAREPAEATPADANAHFHASLRRLLKPLTISQRQYWCRFRLVHDGGIIVLRSIVEEHCRGAFIADHFFGRDGYFSMEQTEAKEEEKGEVSQQGSHARLITSGKALSRTGDGAFSGGRRRESDGGSESPKDVSFFRDGVAGGASPAPSSIRSWAEVEHFVELLRVVWERVPSSTPYLFGVIVMAGERTPGSPLASERKEKSLGGRTSVVEGSPRRVVPCLVLPSPHGFGEEAESPRLEGAEEASLLDDVWSATTPRRPREDGNPLASPRSKWVPCHDVSLHCRTTRYASRLWFIALQEASRRLCPNAVMLLFSYLVKMLQRSPADSASFTNLLSLSYPTGLPDSVGSTIQSMSSASGGAGSSGSGSTSSFLELWEQWEARWKLRPAPSRFFTASPITFAGTCLGIASSVSFSGHAPRNTRLALMALQLLPLMQAQSDRIAAYFRDTRGSLPVLGMLLRYYSRPPLSRRAGSPSRSLGVTSSPNGPLLGFSPSSKGLGGRAAATGASLLRRVPSGDGSGGNALLDTAPSSKESSVCLSIWNKKCHWSVQLLFVLRVYTRLVEQDQRMGAAIGNECPLLLDVISELAQVVLEERRIAARSESTYAGSGGVLARTTAQVREAGTPDETWKSALRTGAKGEEEGGAAEMTVAKGSIEVTTAPAEFDYHESSVDKIAFRERYQRQLGELENAVRVLLELLQKYASRPSAVRTPHSANLVASRNSWNQNKTGGNVPEKHSSTNPPGPPEGYSPFNVSSLDWELRVRLNRASPTYFFSDNSSPVSGVLAFSPDDEVSL